MHVRFGVERLIERIDSTLADLDTYHHAVDTARPGNFHDVIDKWYASEIVGSAVCATHRYQEAHCVIIDLPPEN